MNIKLAVLLSAFLVAGSVAAEEPFEVHFLSGQRLFIAERYEEALSEFQAAYSARQLPRCLIHIAKLHLRLGRAQEAITAYERYLKLVPTPPPDVLLKVQQGLDQAHALLATPVEKVERPAPRKTPIPPFTESAEKRPQSDVASQELSIPRVYGVANAFAGDRADDLWAAGTAIYHFDGKKWEPSYQGWGLELRQIFDGGSGCLWAVSDKNQLLHYDGKRWSRVNPGARAEVVAVWGSGPSDVWLMDQAGSVFHLDGTEWFEKEVTRPIGLKLNRGYVQNQRSVWAVGERGQVVHWDGTRLIAHVTGSLANLYAIWGSSPDDVWVGGWDGALLHYSKNKWQRVAIDPQQYLMSFAGTSANNIWAVGGTERRGKSNTGCILHWDGRKWTVVLESFREDLRTVWVRDAQHVVVAGSEGVVLQFDGKVWSESSMGPAKSVSHVWGKSPTDLWAVGQDGLIAHFDGQRWDIKHSRPSEELMSIARLSATDAWAVGEKGTMLHFDGTEWVLVPSGTHEGLFAIAAHSPRAIWVLGGSQILFYDGARWSSQHSNGNSSFYHGGLWVGSDHDVWAFSEKAVFHFDGKLWSPIVSKGSGSANFPESITGLWVRSAHDVWVIGDDNLYRWNGQRTEGLSLPSGRPKFAPISHAWAFGDRELFLTMYVQEKRGHQLFRTDGQSWWQLPLKEGESIRAVSAIDHGSIWVATDSGVEVIDRASLIRSSSPAVQRSVHSAK